MTWSKFDAPKENYTHKTSVCKTSGFKTSGFETSETSGLQNVRFTKCQVYKTSGLQNVRLQKNIQKYSVLVVGGNPQVMLQPCSHVSRQSDGCVLFCHRYSYVTGFSAHCFCALTTRPKARGPFQIGSLLGSRRRVENGMAWTLMEAAKAMPKISENN